MTFKKILFLSLLFQFIIGQPADARYFATARAQHAENSLSTKSEEDGESLTNRLKRLTEDEMFEYSQVGIYVYDLHDSCVVFTHNERQRMRPASCQKLITAITALDLLGTNYCYRTQLYLHTDTSEEGNAPTSRSASIGIRAGYDPLFDRQDLQAFVTSLKEKGVEEIASPLIIDLSMKDDKRLGWGWCWDDDDVPLTPLLYQNKDGFITAFRDKLQKEEIAWDGQYTEGSIAGSAEMVCCRTRTIDEVLLPMMKESDNSSAESLFYQIAAFDGRKEAGRKQAVRHIKQLIRKTGLDPDNYQTADGSGLSLYNYTTAEQLGRLLTYAYRKPDIYRHLLPSLPIAGEDGTLRRRMKNGRAAGNVRAKTGTVEGVSSLSGYCTAANGHTLCFSIINQGISRTSTAKKFQDAVCQELCR